MGTVGMVIYIVVIIGVFWLIAIRPQKKQEKEHQALIGGLAVDIGTTTVSAVLINMETGEILAKSSSGNGQIRFTARTLSTVSSSLRNLVERRNFRTR